MPDIFWKNKVFICLTFNFSKKYSVKHMELEYTCLLPEENNFNDDSIVVEFL